MNAILAERLGRGKLNGHVRYYSPLSRFAELDLLLVGIAGKKILWTNLGEHAGLRSRLPEFDFDRLMERAQTQIDTIEPFHPQAARDVLAAGSA